MYQHRTGKKICETPTGANYRIGIKSDGRRQENAKNGIVRLDAGAYVLKCGRLNGLLFRIKGNTALLRIAQFQAEAMIMTCHCGNTLRRLNVSILALAYIHRSKNI